MPTWRRRRSWRCLVPPRILASAVRRSSASFAWKRSRTNLRSRCSKRAKKLKCGDPMDPSVDIGTVIHEDAAKEFERRLEAAVQDGARLLHGNNREGALFPPTVVAHVPHTCELILQETFGPVIPIVRTP